ncbi:hypothetical protein [uncultured Desulfobacter sp.]|uniref:hypothetical protein n=1 Tax=uncultured Desulfobacter sp. TaxID=240139 RepID=UPI0029C897E8|nr:hypothetical protein [uncultured Desulfobacter sp.]
MISITMTTADLNGHVELDDGDSKLSNIEARVARQATLDGGCVVTHSGVAHGDRKFEIRTEINADQKASIEYIHENSTLVNVACSEGFFLGVISLIDTSTPNLKMTILIKSKEA